jgi:hypothetical protein
MENIDHVLRYRKILLCNNIIANKRVTIDYHGFITNAILKKIPIKAITYLSILFNSLIRIGHFPTEWKKATIIMIKKPGKDNTNPNSYRPISLLSSVSKIFEKIIYTRLTKHLDATEAIPHHQFGFKP